MNDLLKNKYVLYGGVAAIALVGYLMLRGSGAAEDDTVGGQLLSPGLTFGSGIPSESSDDDVSSSTDWQMQLLQMQNTLETLNVASNERIKLAEIGTLEKTTLAQTQGEAASGGFSAIANLVSGLSPKTLKGLDSINANIGGIPVGIDLNFLPKSKPPIVDPGQDKKDKDKGKDKGKNDSGKNNNSNAQNMIFASLSGGSGGGSKDKDKGKKK